MLSRLSVLLNSAAVFVAAGCAVQEPFVPADQLTACQSRAQELYAENKGLQNAWAGANDMIAGLHTEQQRLTEHLAEAEQKLSTGNSRIDNLLAERSELKDRCESALQIPYDDPVLTSEYVTEIPGFEYDPVTGLYKFSQDLLFDLGSAELKPEMTPVMKEFIEAAGTSEVASARIQIVGHTDDRPIARAVTAAKHETNWHLSTDRADSVIVALTHLGVESERMVAMGYGRFQPLEQSIEERSRQRNRRVELYIVPTGGSLAKWDPVKSFR